MKLRANRKCDGLAFGGIYILNSAKNEYHNLIMSEYEQRREGALVFITWISICSSAKCGLLRLPFWNYSLFFLISLRSSKYLKLQNDDVTHWLWPCECAWVRTNTGLSTTTSGHELNGLQSDGCLWIKSAEINVIIFSLRPSSASMCLTIYGPLLVSLVV